MSVVCAKVYDNRIEIASDSIRLYGITKSTEAIKLFQENEVIVGGCGFTTETSLMRNYIRTHKPESNSEMDVSRFIVDFVKWKNDYSDSKTIQNSYLLIFNGKLFYIEDLSAREVKTFAAIGAGRDFGITAMHLNCSPKEAVKVASDLCCYVSEPIIEYVVVL